MNFEKNLPHQTRAVENTIAVFEGLEIKANEGVAKQYANPQIDMNSYLRKYQINIQQIQNENSIEYSKNLKSNIIDIMMETGTGKTYTYAKTIFELNKLYGLFKFIVVVPMLSIKAGTIDFLKSDNSREHFKEQYGKTINLHIVESQKSNKNKKSFLPTAVSTFVTSGVYEKNQIQVMLINAGMINSETMQKSFDKNLLDLYSIPFEAISATSPILIIDEPHKFAQENKTWENIRKIKPQFILRYGATFTEYQNLIYKLTAVNSFNQNLVKGVIGYVTEFENGKNAMIKFIDSDGKEASFELTDNNTKKNFKITKNESFEKIHHAMCDLYLENLNKSVVILSNGLELKKGDKINPYSYSATLQEMMIEKAIKKHFEIEKDFLNQEIRIKPLTLFFIDNIEEYRKSDGWIKKITEKYIKAEVENLLLTETSEYYKNYLEKTLQDISKTHGGYFSKDNSEKDEAIEQEIIEILHDKQAILNLNNPRRFIFSKWTLREGWDNPNVFQICKLRSSGSDISKLQEVGRGLRLPVNEYGNRMKEKQYYLNYFVDFTENDFVEKLVTEINEKSGAFSIEKNCDKLEDNMIKKICEIYNKKQDDLLEELDKNNVINRANKFKEHGFDYIKQNFSLIFEGVGATKVRKENEPKKKITIRTEKYHELKELWEKLNEKVILEYKIETEKHFQYLFTNFLKENFELSNKKSLINKRLTINVDSQKASFKEEILISNNDKNNISTMNYDDFLKQLSVSTNINLKTIHNSFVESEIDINQYLNESTIRFIKQNFDNYLMYNAIDKFGIEYKKVSNEIHPTKLTDSDGNIKQAINSSDIGILYSEGKTVDNYLYEEFFFDSELEKENIKTNLKEVIVFTKIPKNSIKIAVAGGKSYSPYFAYILNFEDGKRKFYFIIETKNLDKTELSAEEKQKIKHAEKFFGESVKIKFETQFKDKKIYDLINEIYYG